MRINAATNIIDASLRKRHKNRIYHLSSLVDNISQINVPFLLMDENNKDVNHNLVRNSSSDTRKDAFVEMLALMIAAYNGELPDGGGDKVKIHCFTLSGDASDEQNEYNEEICEEWSIDYKIGKKRFAQYHKEDDSI